MPRFDLPNNTAARGFSPGWSTHDCLVVNLAPPSLRGATGLRLIGDALTANPTPGVDRPSTSGGTRNDVGDLTPSMATTISSAAMPSPPPIQAAARRW